MTPFNPFDWPEDKIEIVPSLASSSHEERSASVKVVSSFGTQRTPGFRATAPIAKK